MSIMTYLTANLMAGLGANDFDGEPGFDEEGMLGHKRTFFLKK